MTVIRLDDFLKEALKDPEFKIGYDAEVAKQSIAVAVMQARERAGMTKKALAFKAGLPQSTVARTERGSNTSIDTLSNA
ncbi:helix-turn-helix domain-containing protein [Lactiplantibacillus sp. WILCCON 0030]|uniref:Helix-turn-helix domain-containing protein n=1 Tax=Lactiplantibacillus brownii TaxID=3069269 RepID=A0ABU1AAR4_9LACO|nr:helix-turn-helix domain-containing protein [Lactiplantibacillus brownii]MDQ7938037.1 helix-turn-helix domain-containing protein [Lactiplantibacillus brownii]